MSDNIPPFEIQEEIIKRVVPVRSLLRFRTVSKQWKSFIDSSDFIAHHHHLVKQTHQPDNLLVRYYNRRYYYRYKYVSIADDDSFPQRKFSHVSTPTVKQIKYAKIFDSYHGLVCLYGIVADGKNLVVLWNPSIGKSVGIECPRGSMAFGFGVCPKTLDPKILNTTPSDQIEPVDWPVELFTLSSRASRTLSTNTPLLLRKITFELDQKVIDGVIYWRTINEDQNVIVSFDLPNEEFGEVELPDNLADGNLKISKIKGSLAVLDFVEHGDVCDVWMLMKNGFAKLFTVRNDPDSLYRFDIIGFRKNGELIRKHKCASDNFLVTLEAYEPSTKHGTDLGTHVASHFADLPYMITSYSESLLLVNYSDSIIQG